MPNEAQQQLDDQRARNLADQRAAEQAEPTAAEVADGRFAYAAYGAPSGTNGVTRTGEPLPAWERLSDDTQAGWIAVGRAFAARGDQFEGVSRVRVRVTGGDGELFTVESVGGEHFVGEGYRPDVGAVFLAVRFPGQKRNAVVRLEPFAPALGVEVDAVLLS